MAHLVPPGNRLGTVGIERQRVAVDRFLQVAADVGGSDLGSLLDDAADAFAAAIQSAEGMEGGMAFIQKRPANWVN